MTGPSAQQVERFRTDVSRFTDPSAARLGLAVSGGPDSVALLLLGATAFPGCVEVATVDHGLRPGSGEEAQFVGRLCARYGLLHETLRPERPITGNLQSSARDARYALLEAWRQERSLDWIATGHHADDQAETLLMRLNRGSGVAGLSGIRARNGRVIRPLLGWRRSELAQVVRSAEITPVEDPSNSDPRFDRARLRQELAQAPWIDVAALARSAAALAEADEALDWAAERMASERVVRDGAAWRADIADLPAELRRRLLRRLLGAIDPNAEPRGDELTRLLATLEQGGTGTLGGVKCSGGKVWRFEPAPLRRSG